MLCTRNSQLLGLIESGNRSEISVPYTLLLGYAFAICIAQVAGPLSFSMII